MKRKMISDISEEGNGNVRSTNLFWLDATLLALVYLQGNSDKACKKARTDNLKVV